MVLKTMYTDRLMIVPLTMDMIKSIINRDLVVITNLGFVLHEQWPSKDTLDLLRYLYRSDLVDISGFEVWGIVKKADGIIIGDIGFKGEPNDEGLIEIGYGLVADERQKGYGTEALNTMCKWAKDNVRVKGIIAESLIDNIPSNKMLQKVGMIEDRRDESYIYWKYDKENRGQV